MSGRNVKLLLFIAILGLGIANIVVTLANGGGVTSVGFIFGAMLCALATARIWLTLRHDV
jgi:hypothetical protein